MKKITIKDIANYSGVSTATVSRVLNNSGLVKNITRKKVLEVAEQLNYQPNAIARSLKTEKTNTIGVIIPDISNPFFSTISRGIEDTVRKKNYNLIFGSSDENPEKEKDILKILVENRVDTIVLATTGGNERYIADIKKMGIPIVLVDRKLENSPIDLDLVEEDNFLAAYQLTKHLILQGHSKIGVVNGSLKVSTGKERYAGFKKALLEYEVELDDELVYNGNFTQEDGENAVNKFLKRKEQPTAILSFNNTMSFGVILALTRSGISIPNDIVVASYGEVEAAQLLSPSSIVSIRQYPYEMGIDVGEIIIEKLENNVKSIYHKRFSSNIIY